MKLIFFGPQGCGKGTQSKIIAGRLGICHISTGDLLRKIEGDLRVEIELYTDKGSLVPDGLIVRILGERILQDDCENGFILDGFPRNLSQVEELDKIVDIDKVIEIVISDEESLKRISGRRSCGGCGMIWNVNTFPKPTNVSKCDKCGGKLVQRVDDNKEALRRRLVIYHEKIELILEHYNSVKIDGEQSIGKVSEDILIALK